MAFVDSGLASQAIAAVPERTAGFEIVAIG
jgi:hypothetical protein